jgi:hypothetical protein
MQLDTGTSYSGTEVSYQIIFYFVIFWPGQFNPNYLKSAKGKKDEVFGGETVRAFDTIMLQSRINYNFESGWVGSCNRLNFLFARFVAILVTRTDCERFSFELHR